MQESKECFGLKNRVTGLFEAIFELKAKLKEVLQTIIDEIRVFAWL